MGAGAVFVLVLVIFFVFAIYVDGYQRREEKRMDEHWEKRRQDREG